MVATEVRGFVDAKLLNRGRAVEALFAFDTSTLGVIKAEYEPGQ